MTHQPLSLQQEATHESTPGDRLKELAQISTELPQLVAKNPSAPSELLQELSNSGDVITRQNVVANPNTPTEVLLNLGSEFPEQLLNNPSFFLLWLENPNLLDEMPQTTLLSIFKQESVPISLLEWAVNHLDSQVQLVAEDDVFYRMDHRAAQQHSKVKLLALAVAMNAQTPKTLLEKLVHSQYGEVQEAARLHVNWSGEMTSGWDEAAREALRTTPFPHHRSEAHAPYLKNLAKRDLIPEFVLEELARHQDKDVRSLVAYLPNTPAKILEQLALDEDSFVRSDVAYKSHTPVKILEQLALDKDNHVRSAVAYNSHTPAKILEQLALDKDSYVRSTVAKNPNTPVKTLEQLALDKDSNVRSGVANNANTSLNLLAQLLEQLAQDKNDRVLEDVAKNSNTPVKVLEQLAQDKHHHAVCTYVAQNPNTPVKILEQLAQHGTHWILWAVGSNPNTPLKLLEQLAQLEDYYPREGVAKNPSTPLKLLEQLAQGEICVHESIANNPNTSVNLLEQLGQMKCKAARKGVGSNPNTPLKLLEQLAQEGDNEVRQGITSNPNIPIEFLERLLEQVAQDKNHSLREFVAKHPNTPVSLLLEVTLTFGSQDSTPSLSRFLVLLNSQTPAKALAKYYRSEIWLERYAFAQNPNTPTDTLKALAVDVNRIVRAAAKANLQHR
jgi:pentose-5-phosphate-3-epimerase